MLPSGPSCSAYADIFMYDTTPLVRAYRTKKSHHLDWRGLNSNDWAAQEQSQLQVRGVGIFTRLWVRTLQVRVLLVLRVGRCGLSVGMCIAGAKGAMLSCCKKTFRAPSDAGIVGNTPNSFVNSCPLASGTGRLAAGIAGSLEDCRGAPPCVQLRPPRQSGGDD